MRVLIITLIILLTGCSSNKTKNYSSERAFAEDRIALLGLIAKSNTTVIEEGSTFERVEKIRENICIKNKLKPCPHITLLHSDGIRSPYATVSSVIIHSSLVNTIKDDSELAFIIAHEMSHLVLQHTSQNRNILVNVMKKTLDVANIRPLSVKGMVFDTVNNSSLLIFTGYTAIAGSLIAGSALISSSSQMIPKLEKSLYTIDQEMEISADTHGVLLIKKSDYNTNGAIRFFELRYDIFGYIEEKSNILESIFSSYTIIDYKKSRTHPEYEKRLKNLLSVTANSQT